jgi:aminoglycoside phosphotransferase (APT) family kinase protein
MHDVSIPAALIAGLVSFLSPCVLPLVPPYLIYLTGATIEHVANDETTQASSGDASPATEQNGTAQDGTAVVTADAMFTHRDFCAENMVRGLDGRICVIDNEGLAVGPLAYDLGRVWYRWPMPAAAWRLFLETYAAQRTQVLPDPPLIVWKIAAPTTRAEAPYTAARVVLLMAVMTSGSSVTSRARSGQLARERAWRC